MLHFLCQLSNFLSHLSGVSAESVVWQSGLVGSQMSGSQKGYVHSLLTYDHMRVSLSLCLVLCHQIALTFAQQLTKNSRTAPTSRLACVPVETAEDSGQSNNRVTQNGHSWCK